MLLSWTLLAVLPYIVTSASVEEFFRPLNAERDVSPAEDPPPKITKHRTLIPSIERLFKRDLQSRRSEDTIDDEMSYQHLDPMIDEEKLNNLQAFAARRRNLKQSTFTVKPKVSLPLRLRRYISSQETKTQPASFRQHKAFNFPVSDGIGEISEMKPGRRSKRGASSPAVDAVDENPAQWRRFDNSKPQFVTSRTQPATGSRAYYAGVPQHRVGHTMDENDMHNMKYNEIPPQQKDSARYSSGYNREPVEYRREGEPPRRIIYYANLPDVSRGRPVDPVDYRRERVGYDDRYDFGRSYNKYPRESRYEDNPIRPPPGRDDRYRYRQPENSGSYSIIDAERPPPQGAWPSSPQQQYAYRDPDTMTRYNRIPAPYQQPQAGGRYAYDQRRGSPPPTPDRPNAALHPSRYNPYSRTGNLPRNQLTVTPSGSAMGDEPYRDYNPRQPAPWSLQIGTKLTVKDDGRQMPSPGGQRFYVQSQQQYPSRYLRSEDDPDTRQI